MERAWGLCGLPRTMEFDSGATGSITRALLAPCPSLLPQISAYRCVRTDSGKGRFRLVNSTEEKASCGPQGTAHCHLSSGHKWSGG